MAPLKPTCLKNSIQTVIPNLTLVLVSTPSKWSSGFRYLNIFQCSEEKKKIFTKEFKFNVTGVMKTTQSEPAEMIKLTGLNINVTHHRHFTLVYLFGITRLPYTRERIENRLLIFFYVGTCAPLTSHQKRWTARGRPSTFLLWKHLWDHLHRLSKQKLVKSFMQFITYFNTRWTMTLALQVLCQ